jgi:transposase
LDEGLAVNKVIEVVGTSKPTVAKTKKRYREGGLAYALCEKPRPGQPKTIGPREEAQVTSIACSTPPNGKKRWTICMIRDELIELGYIKTISRESVRKVLKKVTSNPG